MPKYFPNLFMGKGGSNLTPPPLSPVTAVIEVKTKKHLIKDLKYPMVIQISMFFYHYLPVKPPKTVIIQMPLGGAIFICLI